MGFKVRLDIEMEMVFLENIVAKYIDPLEDVVYVAGKRNPLTHTKDIEVYKKNGLCSLIPYYPILSIPVLDTLFDMVIGNFNTYSDVITHNPLMDGGVNLYPNSNVTDALIDYIPDMTVKDYTIAKGYVSSIARKILTVAENNENKLLGLDIESENYEVVVGEDILSFRYKEALNSKRIAKEEAGCDHGSCDPEIMASMINGIYNVEESNEMFKKNLGRTMYAY